MLWILTCLSAWLNAPYDWRDDLDKLREEQDRKKDLDDDRDADA